MARDVGQLYTAGADRLAHRAPSDEALDAALEGCGLGPFRSVLELGGAIGEFTEMLAPRCERLTRIDVSATAAAMARRRLVDFPRVEVVRGAIPDAIPDREYDLVVASEILYFLDTDAFERTLATVRARLLTGGRFVVVHWRTEESTRLFAAGDVHARLRDDPWLKPLHTESTPDFMLDVLERG
ncbi:MAG TPA: SAM-dependent methyltransferase [Solirubrobacteraceae bacterium]|jgi:predicted TPR repeat methyltransferase|nr:SAM-dependent methyltransferase [Solirubrobacteraceae bacterium]